MQPIAQDIARNGGQAVPLVADATSESDIQKLVDAAGNDLDLPGKSGIEPMA